MKRNFILTIFVLSLSTGCSLFSGPSATVKKLMSALESRDIDTAISLWGSAAIKEQGAAKIRSDAENFAQMAATVRAGGQIAKVENMREAIEGDRARVFFIYRASPQNSVGLGFALLKENGSWKLYRAIDKGEEDQPFESSFAPRNPAPAKPESADTPLEMVSPPPPPTGVSKGSIISGGVLNGRATSLPQPPYPPTARAVKAAGTVLVQVTVDESGKVISATAVSGHALLRAAAEAGARQARFNPTIVGGKPVKVNGIISYEFVAQ